MFQFNLAILKEVRGIYRAFPFPDISLDLCEEYKRLGNRNPFGIQAAIEAANFKGCPVEPVRWNNTKYMIKLTDNDKFIAIWSLAK